MTDPEGGAPSAPETAQPAATAPEVQAPKAPKAQKPTITLKAARRKAIEAAATIEELRAATADLKPEELDAAQYAIYEARRRIVRAG